MNYLIGITTSILCMVAVGFSDFLSAICAKRTNAKLTVIVIFTFQTLVSLAIYLIFNHTFQPNLLLIVLTIIAGILQTFGLTLFYKAMTMENISIISPIFATSGIFTVVFGIIFLKEVFSTLQIISIAVVIAGTLLASTDFSIDARTIKLSSPAIKTAFLGTLIFGIGLIFITYALKNGNFYQYNVIYPMTTLLTSLIVYKSDLVQITKINKKSLDIFVLGLTAGTLYALATATYAVALKLIPSYIVAAIFNAFPAVTVILGFILFKERLNKTQVLGITAVIVGLLTLSL